MKQLTLTLKYPILFLFTGILFFSCEYNSDEKNYHELVPPEESIIVKYNLADISADDVVYIYSPTSLSYNLNISSGNIMQKEFYLNNQRIPEINGNIVLDEHIINKNQDNILELKLRLTSGSGSLAEFLGGEKSEYSFRYTIKYVDTNINLNIEQKINSDKYLEIYWKKPVIAGTEIESYTIYSYNNLEEILIDKITDSDKTSFIDKNYVYGSKTYKIVTKYKSKDIEDKEDLYTVKYNEFTSKYFETSSAESLKLNISWNNPNNIGCKYVLKWNDSIIYIDNGSAVSVERPSFPMEGSLYYQLYLLPKDASFIDYEKYPKIINFFEEKYFGESLQQYVSSLVYASDVKHNLLLVARPGSIAGSFGFRAYNKDNLSLIKTSDIPNLSSDVEVSGIATSPTTGLVAIHYRDQTHSDSNLTQVWVFSDYTLTKVLGKFPIDDFPTFFLTDNDKLIINKLNREYTSVYDIRTGKLENKQSHVKDKLIPAISADGKYIFNYYLKPGYQLYSYNNASFTLLKEETKTDALKRITFNPKTQNQAVMQYANNKFDIYEVPSMNKIKTIQGEFICFDSFTGNILYVDKDFAYNSQLKVLNSSYDKTIFKIKVTESYYYLYTHLVNNILIARDYYVNISK